MFDAVSTYFNTVLLCYNEGMDDLHYKNTLNPERGKRRKETRWPSLCRGMRDMGLDDKQLAHLLQTHWRSVQTWRLGQYHPSPKHLAAISETLRIPLGTLISDSPILQKNLPE